MFLNAVIARMSDDGDNLGDNLYRHEVAVLETGVAVRLAKKHLADNLAFTIAELGYGGDFQLGEGMDELGIWLEPDATVTFFDFGDLSDDFGRDFEGLGAIDVAIHDETDVVEMKMIAQERGELIEIDVVADEGSKFLDDVGDVDFVGGGEGADEGTHLIESREEEHNGDNHEGV